MLLFIFPLLKSDAVCTDFNTSHVTVYRIHTCSCGMETDISIHLMLLFITVPAFSECIEEYFNTSHVTVYHDRHTGDDRPVSEFQYISCYCLSRYNVCQTVEYVNFNTSHVTVYRKDKYKQNDEGEFQYISCYCLSGKNK